jgi:hypothetical protein
LVADSICSERGVQTDAPLAPPCAACSKTAATPPWRWPTGLQAFYADVQPTAEDLANT